MLLNPAQGGFLNTMRGLPDSPAANDDFSLYNAAYNPLKAYLITTTNPEKSQPKWLTPVFMQYWAGSRPVDDQKELAQKQIDFYGNELLRHPPYSITPDSVAVEHTRVYLSKFLGVTRVYQAMLADGDKAGQLIDFNQQYPGRHSVCAGSSRCPRRVLQGWIRLHAESGPASGKIRIGRGLGTWRQERAGAQHGGERRATSGRIIRPIS